MVTTISNGDDVKYSTVIMMMTIKNNDTSNNPN